jgi:transposase
MELRPGSQFHGRRFQDAGYVVRIIPAQFVKPYLKSNRNAFNDGKAMAEAGSRRTMRAALHQRALICASCRALRGARQLKTRIISLLLSRSSRNPTRAGTNSANVPWLVPDRKALK